MNIKKIVVITILVIGILALFFVFNKKEPAKSLLQQEYLKAITYSNICGAETSEKLKNTLRRAGIPEKTTADFLDDVFFYNKVVGAKLGDNFVPAKEQFRTIYNLVPTYNLENIEELWKNYDVDDIGENCRITAFRLLDDIIDVENPKKEYSRFMFMDEESLAYPKRKINRTHIPKFQTIFSSIPTELTKNQNIHIQKIKEHFIKHKIKFKNSDNISLITVWMHNDLDNILFVGHTGVLIKNTDNKWWFVEKVSFQEPYQLLIFKNRIQLNDYLMAKYDVAWGQLVARPMIFENENIIEGFRLNPKTTKKQKQ